MNRKNIGEIEISPIGLYIRSTSDITLKWKDIRNSSDINELNEIIFGGSKDKLYKDNKLLVHDDSIKRHL